MAGQDRSFRQLFRPGAVFAGKYRIVRELGSGGFSMVFLAHQDKMDRQVALKVLKTGITEVRANAKERFLREVKIISKLRHPNTVTIHDFGEAGPELLYMVLEYVEGDTLKQLLQREGAQPPRRALALVAQVARSLAEAHRHGVIHRDLKPANLMVTDLETETDFVKVLDFGIARLLRSDQRDLTQETSPEGDRQLIGTPRYMSPEQVRGESLSPASDVYSLGLILYELLSGEPAVQGDTTMALISQQISPEPLNMEGLRALPPNITELIRGATAKTLGSRYSNAQNFAQAVEQTLVDLGGAPPESATARQMNKRSGRFGPDVSRQVRQAKDSQQVVQREGEPWGSYDEGDPRRTTQDDLASQAGSPFVGNSHVDPSSQADSELGDDLPPPPGDTNPFALADDSDSDSKGHDRDDDTTLARAEKQKDDDESDVLELVAVVVQLTFLGLVAVSSLYVTFLVVSAIFDQFLSGDLKLVAALILSAGIPLLTALGENSRRERLNVVRDPVHRISRVFMGSAVFSFATALLCALVLTGAVIQELRSNPNWFLSDRQKESFVGDVNASVSMELSNYIEKGTRAIGLYDGTTSAPKDPADRKRRRPPEPPEPTRPATRGELDEGEGDSDGKEADPADQPGNEAPDDKGNGDSDDSDDKGEVEW
ncbi:MAG: serine/threonine protein kinase [Persicimonas sp.]